MNLLLKNIKSGMDERPPSTDFEVSGLNSCIAQFYVFCGEKYLGWDCFDKNIITIGKSPAADLVLSDDSLSDIQAAFTITDDGIIASNAGAKGSLLVNDEIITERPINPLDFIKIGKYTIKIKLKKINSGDNAFKPELSATEKNESQREVTLEIVPDIDPALEETFKVDIAPKAHGISKRSEESSFSLEKTLEIKQKTRRPENRVEEKAIPVIVAPQESEIDFSSEAFVYPVHYLEDDIDLAGEKQETSLKSVKKKPSLEKTLKLVPKVKQPEIKVEEKVKKVSVIQQEPSENSLKENSFPASFFNPVYDLEDNEEEDDDFPANFSLKDKLTGSERNAGRTLTSNKLFEIIKLRGDNVISVHHLNNNESHCLIDQKNSFCTVEKKENDTACLFFTEPLLNKINTTKNKKLETKKAKSLKSLAKKQNTYKAYLPLKGETTVSDGFYDYVLRPTFVAEKIDEVKPFNDIPLKKRIIQSTAFRNTTKAIIVHLVVLVVLSFTIEIPDIEEFKNPETHFVVVDTKNIHKPVKPKPKPKPIVQKKATKIAKKKPAKQGAKVASLRKKRGKKTGKPKAGGGHKGNLINRNVNQVGLLGALGLKTGITVKPNEALAAVTNIDAITSTHSREAKIKIGGIVGSLGDGNIAIPTGGVFNSKGSTDVLRSAGIGGDGSIAALEAGNTGQRAVEGTVSAPLTRKVRFKGGGISRDAVAKVINEHLDEISYCYESSLIGDPTLMGKVVFEWKILTSGKVGEVKIKSSTLRSSDIHSCIKSAIRTWRFPKPKGGAAIISYPFVFDVSGF